MANPTALQVITATNRAAAQQNSIAHLLSIGGNTVPKQAPLRPIKLPAQEKGPDFWSTVGAILDTPRRAAVGVVNAGVNAMKDVEHVGTEARKGNLLPEAQDLAGILTGGIQGAIAPLTGAKSFQRTSSDIIKEIAPGTPDVVRGVGGFALDVATDPLTYIGIGALGRGAKLGVEALKAGEIGTAAKAVGKGVADYTGATAVKDIAKSGKGLAQALARNSKGEPALAITDGTERAFAVNRGGEVGRNVGPSNFEPGVSDRLIVNRTVTPEEVEAAKLPVDTEHRSATSQVTATNPALQDPVQQIGLAGRQAAQAQALKHLPDYIKKLVDNSRYTHVMRSGARATELGGEGVAKWDDRINTVSGYDLMKRYMTDAANTVKGMKGMVGVRGATEKIDQWHNALKLTEAFLDSKGVVLHLEHQKTVLNVSPGQAISVLLSHSDPEVVKAVKLALGNNSTSVPVTNILDAVVEASRNLPESAQAALDALRVTANPRTKTNTKLPLNVLALDGKSPLGVADVKGKRVSVDWMTQNLLRAVTDPEQVAKILKVRAQNDAAHVSRGGAEALQISDELKTDLTALVSDPSKLGDALIAINGIPTQAAKVAARGDALTGAGKVGAAQTAAELEADHQGVAATAQAAAKVADAARTGDAAKAADANAKLSQDAAGSAEANVDSVEASLAPEDVLTESGQMVNDGVEGTVNVSAHLEDKAYRAHQSMFGRFFDPLNKKFDVERGMKDTSLYQIWNAPGLQMQAAMNHVYTRLNTIARTGAVSLTPGGTHTVTAEALTHALAGTVSQEPRVAALTPQITDLMHDVIPPAGSSSLGSALERVNLPLEAFNYRAAQKGLYPGLEDLMIDLDRVSRDRAAGLAKTDWDAAFLQIREHAQDVKDPVQFMSAMHVLTWRAAKEATIQTQAERQLVALGMAHIGPKTGMLRATWQSSTPLGVFANPELRVTREGGEALQALNDLSRYTPGGSLNQALSKYFDPLQQMWKVAVTLPRPGHHVRNAIGNFVMTFMAEGVRGLASATRDMTKLMAAHNSYDGVDAMRMLAARGDVTYAGGTEKLYSLRISGKKVDLTNEEVWQRMKNNGLLRDFQHSSQIDVANPNDTEGVASAVSGLQRTSNAVLGSAPIRALGKVSEFNDHASQTVHMAQILRKFEEDGYVAGRFGKKLVPRDTEDLFRLAAERIRFYHPDGSTLTDFDRKMKRIIPFYNWMKSAGVAMAESSVLHPGRALVFPKASYNLAVSMGVDPDSLYDPFPADRIFPSYMTENITGPQFKIGGDYFSVSPGISTLDSSEILNDPTPAGLGKYLLGNVSPLIKTPIELATGNTLSTGATIKDWSDYADQSTGLSALANATGISPTGSIASLLSGKGLDPTRKASNGEANQGIGIVNLLTGAGITNDNSASATRSAIYEQQQKATGGVPF